tara:strand:+ start:275 stop:670 length:396 start_codon:yes stop_codon:yes gene_type:complete
MNEHKLTLKVIRPEAKIMSRQALPYFFGVSRETVGAEGISMNLVVIPPGSSPKAHYHKDFETAIYILKGEVNNLYGEELKESCVTRAGDFIFIPPGLPHKPINMSDTEPAMAIVSRNDPDEIENVVLVDEG